MKRYAIGNWKLLAAIGAPGIECRVVFEMESHALLCAQELVDQKFALLSGERLKHVAESVEGAFSRDDRPEVWGFVERGHLPYWAWKSLNDAPSQARHLGDRPFVEPVVDIFAPFVAVLTEPGDGTPPKIGLIVGDVQVADPALSECGRFVVDPLEAYGLSSRQVGALKRLNSMLSEAVHDALNAGCLRIQQQLGVAAGDLAGLHFATGAALEVATRLLGEYLVEEINAGAGLGDLGADETTVA
ncbi:hypothetical protein [Acidovorax sp.]|uniref:hypothetical protein n=1 Tax=Acidovorax sp. TaxID=1872122 RepID=UPI00391F3EA0